MTKLFLKPCAMSPTWASGALRAGIATQPFDFVGRRTNRSAGALGCGDELAELLERIAQEYRKRFVFVCGSGQIWTAARTSSELRDSFASAICHRMKRNQARLLLPTEEAATVERLVTGPCGTVAHQRRDSDDRGTEYHRRGCRARGGAAGGLVEPSRVPSPTLQIRLCRSGLEGWRKARGRQPGRHGRQAQRGKTHQRSRAGLWRCFGG